MALQKQLEIKPENKVKGNYRQVMSNYFLHCSGRILFTGGLKYTSWHKLEREMVRPIQISSYIDGKQTT